MSSEALPLYADDGGNCADPALYPWVSRATGCPGVRWTAAVRPSLEMPREPGVCSRRPPSATGG